MKRESRRIIILFILLILLFGLIYIYNDYKNRDINVDRKVNLLFNKYSYEEVVKESKKLFLDAIYISNSNNLDIELNRLNRINYYVINDYNNYKKIINEGIIITTLTKEDTNKYMKIKRIIKDNNSYFIEDYVDKVNEDYIGSILDVIKYDEESITFRAANYYCPNNEYVGLLDNLPKCEYKTNNIQFKVVLEDGTLKLSNIENIIKIVT